MTTRAIAGRPPSNASDGSGAKRRDRARVAGVCTFLAAAMGSGCAPAAEKDRSPADRPNVVLIISDDHGWPHHGFMIGTRD